jgi:Colicin-E5 Imm protein
MTIDRQKLYHAGKDFFDHDGNAVMKLSREAAIAVCLDAARQGLLTVRIEGGIWADGTFEARLDAIWDGADPPVAENDASENNRAAANFIQSQPPNYNAFVITALPFTEVSSTDNSALLVR